MRNSDPETHNAQIDGIFMKPNDDEEHDLVAYEDQVGGHRRLCYHPSSVNWLVKKAAPREIKFYKDAQQLAPALSKIMCAFGGTVRIGGDEWLVLENLTAGMKDPCILDVKIGHYTYDVDASEEKIARTLKKSKCSTSEMFGFRLAGLKTFSADKIADYEYKRALTRLSIDQVVGRLEKFVAPLDPTQRNTFIQEALGSLEEIRTVIQSSPVLLYSSSLLLIYDPDSRTRQVRIIDFTHGHVVAKDDSRIPDSNYLSGLDSFIAHFMGLTRH